jgi:hypothetical protein
MAKKPKKASKVTPFWEQTPLVGETELFSHLAEEKGSALFLGRYALAEVIAVLGKRNFLREARKRKLWPLAFNLDSSAYPLQRFQIFHRDRTPSNLIVDLKIREGLFRPPGGVLLGRPFPEQKCLMFEWLTLQNPVQEFGGPWTPLPGQLHPGLNIGKKVMDLFIYLGRVSGKDALLAFPAYFHNALLFSRYFTFVHPEKQAEVLAIRRAFRDLPWKQLAWIVHFNCLVRSDGSPYEWKAEEEILPLSRFLKELFDSRDYRDAVRRALPEFRFTVDWEAFSRKSSEIGPASG